MTNIQTNPSNMPEEYDTMWWGIPNNGARYHPITNAGTYDESCSNGGGVIMAPSVLLLLVRAQTTVAGVHRQIWINKPHASAPEFRRRLVARTPRQLNQEPARRNVQVSRAQDRGRVRITRAKRTHLKEGFAKRTYLKEGSQKQSLAEASWPGFRRT